MKKFWPVFLAIFVEGIASLLMELSLLREFVYVIGSSAFSNAVIISVFLAGLAAGTYVSMGKRYASKTAFGARKKFAVLQIIFITFIFLFSVTKEYFIYVSMSQMLVILYFIVCTFIPSMLSGMSYATMVELLYHRGERFVVYIYAVSTIGNVIGGLLHGYVFTYLTGIQTSYAVAAACASLALALVYRFPKRVFFMMFVFFATAVVGIIQSNSINERFYIFDDLLFRKYSPSGLVEVWRTEDGAVELTTNNVHEYYSYDWDVAVHKEWAATTLEIINAPSDVLLLGYGSGVSTAAYLSSPLVTRVDTVENTQPVLEAGSIFFPDEYRRAIHDPRSRVIMQDFRNYIRFTDQTYDIILLDHSILDPLASGFFTSDFFDQTKRVLRPGGVIAILGVGLSYDTMRTSFPYVYTYVGPERELIKTSGFFLMTRAMMTPHTEKFALENEANGESPLYSDHGIKSVSFTSALTAIKHRISRSIF